MAADRKLASVAVERELLKDVVRDRLREAILDGTLEPGEILRDVELAEWLEVSRTPVRDALNDLERIGLIETYPNRYTRVALKRASDLVPALDALAVLHGGAVLLAVPTLSERAAVELQRLCDELVDVVRSKESAAVRDAFVRLFDGVLEQTENDIYRRRTLRDIDGLYFQAPIDTLFLSLDAQQRDVLADATGRLSEAFGAKDAQRARHAAEAMHTAMLPDE